MKFPRLPFEEAITNPKLLKGAYEKLSIPQQSALRIFYGLPLDAEGLKYWSMFQGGATFDHLGFTTAIKMKPYEPFEYDEAWAIWGRRAAKTSGFLSFVMVYEALLGGHTQYASPKQEVVSFMVAQKLDVAQAILRDFVEPLISDSPLLSKELVKSNADGILLKSGHRIAPAPPVIKNFRYYAIPVVCMDEVAFWYKDAEAANPDYEVIRAVEPAQGQFPYHKRLGASTPWSKEGVIWEAANAGTNGDKLEADDDRKGKFKDVLVMVAPTPSLLNPLYSDRKWFERSLRKDPEAYMRETLVQFVDAVSGVFTELQLNSAVDQAPPVREPVPGHYYIGTLDPAFRGDDFAFTIGHYEAKDGFVQDLLKTWTPTGGSKLRPSIILDEIKVDLEHYKVDTVYSDQYQLESLQELALDRGFSIIGVDFTASSKAKFFGSFLQLLRGMRVKLVRNFDQFQQFLQIRRYVGSGGYVRISAPPGKHDDMVTCTVMCGAMAIRGGFESAPVEEKVPTLVDRVMKRVSEQVAQANHEDQEYL